MNFPQMVVLFLMLPLSCTLGQILARGAAVPPTWSCRTWQKSMQSQSCGILGHRDACPDKDVPCDDDEEDREIAAGDKMREQLNFAFHPDRPSAIQYSGPSTMALDQGVYELMGRCTHPGHAHQTKLFFITMLLPIIIICKTC